MQRIRRTDEGLQVTHELDVFSFSPAVNGDVRIGRSRSEITGGDKSRGLIIEGKDNLGEFGDWLNQLRAEDPGEPTPSSFDTHIVDEHKWAAVISKVPVDHNIGYSSQPLRDADNVEAPTPESADDSIQEIVELTDEIAQMGQRISNLTSELFGIEAIDLQYPFKIPAGLDPIITATHTGERLQLQFHDLLRFCSMPNGAAQQLGDWTLQGLTGVKKKSVWD